MTSVKPHLFLINYFNLLIKYVVLYLFIAIPSFSSAGSYEDFFQALQHDQVQVVSSLLNRGFDPNTVNLNAEPAIFVAFKNESFKALEALIKHPKSINQDGRRCITQQLVPTQQSLNYCWMKAPTLTPNRPMAQRH